ncbi:MAG: hypothetical protein ACLFVN_07485 [Phycisphaeraceae bacterium]
MKTQLIQRFRALPAPGPAAELVLETGTIHDYRVLARHHYRAGAPLSCTRVLVLRDPRPTVVGRYLGRASDPQPVAVLVESMPCLACRMRDWALAGRFGGWLAARDRATLIKQELRTISRVVVDPRWRGLGLAVRMVRHALATATTLYTEAMAAMGRVHPFFELAGMHAYHRPSHTCDLRLRAALASAGLEEAALADPGALHQRIAAMALPRQRFLFGEFARWHTSSGLGRSHRRSDDPREHLRHARSRLLMEPVYYLSDRREYQEKRDDSR